MTSLAAASDGGEGGQSVQGTGVGSTLRVTVLDQTDAALVIAHVTLVDAKGGERTVAVDTRSVPLGAPVFLATTYPLSSRPLNRLMMAQDTGGAIRGAVRADFFGGFGDEAGRQAGRMKQDGKMWILWPVNAGAPRSG
jgi:membrane-bound lytic murein transglycosylase